MRVRPALAPVLPLPARPVGAARLTAAVARASGQVVSHLNELGFECVINAKRDFYADIAQGTVSAPLLPAEWRSSEARASPLLSAACVPRGADRPQ